MPREKEPLETAGYEALAGISLRNRSEFRALRRSLQLPFLDPVEPGD